MGTLVRAIAPGFANGSRKRVGDVFELPDGVRPGKWLQVIEETPAKSKAELAAELKAANDAKAQATKKAMHKQNAQLRNLPPEEPKAPEELL
jgi:hypothetical protein